MIITRSMRIGGAGLSLMGKQTSYSQADVCPWAELAFHLWETRSYPARLITLFASRSPNTSETSTRICIETPTCSGANAKTSLLTSQVTSPLPITTAARSTLMYFTVNTFYYSMFYDGYLQ